MNHILLVHPHSPRAPRGLATIYGTSCPLTAPCSSSWSSGRRIPPPALQESRAAPPKAVAWRTPRTRGELRNEYNDNKMKETPSRTDDRAKIQARTAVKT
ncbi:hypothetical protein FA13DRAFT_1462545 [Coprinellus micaceus]|uniref:Uncharacterized protein n=1 Tax=Coprinellus micaceus TaxID=71717 RepID=A0A4Y7SMB2_COPMI|nr:hypothetical protein FA13DRAFT_1462545 [Coprinellus micaceus]